LLGDFNVRVGKEEIFKTTIGDESLNEISNDKELDCRSQWLHGLRHELSSLAQMLGL
jgi:hypothetical protein